MVDWQTTTDWDANRNESGATNDATTNTDYTDTSILKHGYEYQPSGLMNGLVGWWPLTDDSGQDYSGNDNHGTLNGGVTTGVAGKGGLEAMSFDGTDDYVDTGLNPNNVTFSEVSISIWLKSDNWTGSDVLGFFGGYDGSDRWQFGTNYGSEPNDASNMDWTFSNSGIRQFDATPYLTDGQYHHFVALHDGTDNVLYIDGTERARSSATIENPNTTMKIGLFNGNYWGGNTASVGLYDRALNSSEISRLYEMGVADLARPPTDGVSRYPLDGNATDAWGTNDGTENGGLAYSSDAIRGQSGDFDGTDDWIDTASDFADSQNELTLAAWVKPDDPSSNNKIVGKDSDTNGRSWNLGVRNNSVRFEIHGSHGVFDAGTVKQGEWYMVAGVWDGSTAYVYINGEPVGTTSSTGSINDTSSTVSIGRRNYSGSEDYFDGHIDDVRIYDYALSLSEVFELYQWGTRGKDMRKDLVTA